MFVLTSIVWREAWKYGERAYRYCLHDIGHAWQALALSARAIGCDSFAVGHFLDDEVARMFHLNSDEWPMLIVSLHGKSIPVREADTGKTVWFGGQANQLSKETIAHPLIDSIHFATKRSSSGSSGTSFAEPALTGSGEIKLPPPASSTRSFGEVARMRRSALDFLGGKQSMSLAELSAILAVTAQPLSADFARHAFHPALFVCSSRRWVTTRRLQVLAGACRVGADQEWRPARSGRWSEPRAGPGR